MKRLRAQFGLRTFFLVITATAILLGLFGIRYYQQYLHKQAVAAIGKIGGTTMKDEQQRVIRVNLLGEKVTDAEFERLAPHLRNLPELRELDLVQVPITDESMPDIERLTQLTELYLFETEMTDEAIEQLRSTRPELKVLLEEPDPIASRLASRRIYPHAITGLAWSPNGKRLVTGSGDGVLRVWNARDLSAPERSLPAHTDWAFSVAYSSDGTMLASDGGDNLVRLWNTETWEMVGELQGHTDDVHAVCFSPDDRMLYSASDDRTIRVWNVAEQAETNVLRGHTAQVTCLAISPDGTRLASSSRDDSVRLWETLNGELVGVLSHHTRDVMAVAFDATGQSLVSAGYDGQMLFWNVNSSSLMARLSSHEGRIFCLAWGSDGRVFSGGEDALRLTTYMRSDRQAYRTEFVSRISPCPIDPRLVAATTADGELLLIDAFSLQTLVATNTAYGKRGI